MDTNYTVVIVGAGPVGLLTALKLGQKGIRTLVVEKHGGILDAPRAIAYMPVVVNELRKLGLLEDVEKSALVIHAGPAWRTVDGTELAALGPTESEIAPTADTTAALVMGQQDLARIVLDHLSGCDSVDVKFSTTYVGVEAHEHDPRVTVHAGAGENTVRTQWVGSTWTNFRFTAADVRYDFEGEGGYRAANFIVDPEDWAIIARTGRYGVWSLAYGESFDSPGDDRSVRERSEEKIPRFLPGSKDYELLRLRPYTAQQRCASTFIEGRVVLAGDAAHSNNPVGGLELTGGILDAVVVGNALVRCLQGGEGDAIVQSAAESRRNTWLSITDPMSRDNYLRLCSEDSGVASSRAGFFERLRTDEGFAAASHASFGELLPDAFE